jgi:hypothetical protein
VDSTKLQSNKSKPSSKPRIKGIRANMAGMICVIGRATTLLYPEQKVLFVNADHDLFQPLQTAQAVSGIRLLQLAAMGQSTPTSGSGQVLK